jgi:hypothetical protein
MWALGKRVEYDVEAPSLDPCVADGGLCLTRAHAVGAPVVPRSKIPNGIDELGLSVEQAAWRGSA